jgi:hypothetical protein
MQSPYVSVSRRHLSRRSTRGGDRHWISCGVFVNQRVTNTRYGERSQTASWQAAGVAPHVVSLSGNIADYFAFSQAELLVTGLPGVRISPAARYFEARAAGG